MNILLSIDGSTTATGWAVFNCETKELLDYGVFKSDLEDRRDRIRFMINGIKETIQKYKPSHIVMEDVPPSINNSSTVLSLGVLQGGVLGLSFFEEISIDWTLVPVWHSDLDFYDGTKEGKSSDNMKRKSIEFANSKYGLKLIYKSKSSKFNEDNQADAICIGCHYLGDYPKKEKRGFGKRAVS